MQYTVMIPRVFSNSEFGQLEIVTIDGKEHFPATVSAKMLGYVNPHKAISDHCRWVTKREVPHPQNPDKTIRVNYIPEGDLYRLIIHSKLPNAERFEKWVMDDVLPALRRNYAYVAGQPPELPAVLVSFLKSMAELIAENTKTTREFMESVHRLLSEKPADLRI
ncbi:hypothetical protein FACS18949_14490 [Clostridia bacterium]|nr:hypothetical protein FACS18949_14490 [Clostridia bacterium]